MVSRRQFLGYCFLTTTALVFNRALANIPQRTLYFYNTHTGEYLKEVYWENGVYIPQALNRINYILRDFRSGEVKQIDIKLLDILYVIKAQLGTEKPFHIISGYRSPSTNDFLRKVSTGVANKSMHIEGKAVDIYIPDVPLRILRDTAINLKAGGVGYYPASSFVHIDSGRFRVW